MKVKVLGASGSEVPGHECPAFLVDGRILLDAGTIGRSLNIREEHGIRHILLTHAHFDHIKGIPFLLDNLVIRNTGNTVTVSSGKDVLEDLKKNLFNDRIWPDFSRIPTPERPALAYRAITPSRRTEVEEYTVVMEKVHHSVPAYGYVVENAGRAAIAYAGDTGPTERLWARMSGYDVRCLIVEASFPNRMERIALMTGHLTPALLSKEIRKMSRPPARICVMHLKPQYQGEIEHEIAALARDDIEILKEGQILTV